MKSIFPIRLSLIGYLIAAGLLGTMGTLAYESFTTPSGSAVFPADTSAPS